MKNRLLAVLMSVAMVIGLLPMGIMTVSAAVPFAGGDGSEGNPYQISTVEQLDAVRHYSGSDFILNNDIDLAGYGDWWPIGNSYDERFTGFFDGNNHIIKNMKIYHHEGNINQHFSAGLFGHVGSFAIKNLGVEDIDIHTTGYCSSVGGIVGVVNNGNSFVTISNCYSTGNIYAGSDSAIIAGGIVGGTSGKIRITNCYSTTNISAVSPSWTAYAGGIVGNSSGIIRDCYNKGNISSSSREAIVGGISGSFVDGEIINSYNTGDVSADNARYPFVEFTSIYMGGIAGNIWETHIESCYCLNLYDSNYGIALNSSQMKDKSNFINWDFDDIWDISPNLNDGYPLLRNMALVTDIMLAAFSQLAYTNFIKSNNKDKTDIGKTVEQMVAIGGSIYNNLAYNDEKNKKVYNNRDKMFSYSDYTWLNFFKEHIGDWVLTDFKNDTRLASFCAVAFTNPKTNQTVIAYRGTDEPNGFLKFMEHTTVNATYGFFGALSWQHEVAYNFYEKNKTMNVWLTGHSLGGALAQFVSQVSDENCITFNAPSSTAVAYKKEPVSMAKNFHGIDKWKYTDYVNIRDGVGNCGYGDHPNNGLPATWGTVNDNNTGGFLDPTVFYRDRSIGQSKYRAHGINTILERTTYVVNDNYDRFVPIERTSSPGSFYRDDDIYLGTSGADNPLFLKNTIRGRIIYGGYGDDNLYGGFGDNIFVGGKGNSILNGGGGSDAYIYWKNDGVSTIYDIGGNDQLDLYGFSEGDIISFDYDSNFAYVKCNNESIVKISKNRSKLLNSFDVHVHNMNDGSKITSRLQDWSNWKNVKSVRAACPVEMQILDANGDVVMTLGNDEESVTYTDFGNFYVIREENGNGFVHIAEIGNDDYSIRIAGLDNGTMDYSMTETRDDGITVEFSAKDISITNGQAFTSSLDTTAQMALIEEGGTGEVILLSEVILPDSVTLNKTELILKKDDTYQLTAVVEPMTATNTDITWSSDDDNIATVDSGGKITAKVEGFTTITATVYGEKIASCYVEVRAESVTALISNLEFEDNSLTANIDLYNITEDKISGKLIISVYDNNDRLMGVKFEDIIDLEKQVVMPVSHEIPLILKPENYSVKAFFWNDISYMNPLSGVHGTNLVVP